MNIIYISSTCSREKYTQYVENRGVRISQQAQKYNLLLAEGLSANGADVHLISSRPINRSVETHFWMKGEKERVNDVDFSYVAFANYPILRHICVFFGVFFRVLFSRKNRKETAVVCDALNIVASAAALTAAALRNYKTVGIVTDVPCHTSYAQKISFSQRINLAIMRNFKSYLLLTEPMGALVNPKKNPYVVLEGHADVSMENIKNLPEEKHRKKVCMYAGSLMKIYGIENLVEGFAMADIPGTELHVYGSGDYAEDLKKLSEKYENVKYLGIAPNETIVQEELKATLLVNPRPTNEEYTKYSFPSKNMEYMASGTPVLTTCLPGMPEEYNDYVFLLKEESAEGVKNALEEIFSLSPQELHSKGAAAKTFVLEQKNNVVQARKVLEMIKREVCLCEG